MPLIQVDERVTVQFLGIPDKARASCDGWDQVPSPVKPEYEIHIYICTISNTKCISSTSVTYFIQNTKSTSTSAPHLIQNTKSTSTYICTISNMKYTIYIYICTIFTSKCEKRNTHHIYTCASLTFHIKGE